MAKSIRSKRRRKMRAIKRVRYGEKELERLKKTLANDTTTKKEIDEVMTDISEIATVSEVKKIDKKKNKETNNSGKMDDNVELNDESKKPIKNKHGSYPVWMHQRKIRQKVKAYKKKTKMNKKKK